MDPIFAFQDLFNQAIVNVSIANISSLSVSTFTVTGSFKLPYVGANQALITDSNSTTQGLTLTNGQLVVGTTGGAPIAANITSSDGSITVANGPGSIDIITNPVGVFESIKLENVTPAPTTSLNTAEIYRFNGDNGLYFDTYGITSFNFRNNAGLNTLLALSSTGATSPRLNLSNTSAQITLGTGNTVTLSASPTSTYTLTIPDVGASSFVMTEGAQSIVGTKSFTTTPISNGLTSFSTTSSEMIFTGSANSGFPFKFTSDSALKDMGIALQINGSTKGTLAAVAAVNSYVTGTQVSDTVLSVANTGNSFWLGDATTGPYCRFNNSGSTFYQGLTSDSLTSYQAVPMVFTGKEAGSVNTFQFVSPATSPCGIQFYTSGNTLKNVIGTALNNNDFVTGSADGDLVVATNSSSEIVFGIGTAYAGKFDINKNLNAQGQISTNSTTQCTGSGTGSIQAQGGLSVAKDTFLGGQLYLDNVTSPTSGVGASCIASLNTANTHGPQLVAFSNSDAANTNKFALLGPKYTTFGSVSAVTLTLTANFYKLVMSCGASGTTGNRWGCCAAVGASGLGVFTAPSTGSYRVEVTFNFPATAGTVYVGALYKNPTFAAVDGSGSYRITAGTQVAQWLPYTSTAAFTTQFSGVQVISLSAADTLCVAAYTSAVSVTTIGTLTSVFIEQIY